MVHARGNKTELGPRRHRPFKGIVEDRHEAAQDARCCNGKRPDVGRRRLCGGQSGTITAVVNALAKAGVDLGENDRSPKAEGADVL